MACWPASSAVPSDRGSNAAVSSVASKTTATTDSSPERVTLQAIYIASPQEFPEVRDFVSVSATQYHLDLVRYDLPMRSAVEAYLAARPAVKAIFMGTRRTDPHGEFLTHFNPTDKDWPQFLRVNALIDWHYAEVWAVSSLPTERGTGRSPADINTIYSSFVTLTYHTAIYTTGASPRSAV
jgi:FAD synthetase